MSKNIQLDKENKLLILDNGAIKIFRHVESAGSFADDTVALTPEAAGKLKLALSNLVYETTVFDEYNEIVKIIDDRFEYKNGNLSIVEIVKDAFSRIDNMADNYAEALAEAISEYEAKEDKSGPFGRERFE